MRNWSASHRHTWIVFQCDSEGRGPVDQENEVVYLVGDRKGHEMY